MAELEALRGARHELAAGGTLELAEHRADVLLAGAGRAGSLVLDDALAISWEDGTVRLTFADDRVGCGRDERAASVDAVRDLRVLVDSSAVEVFVNGGELALATRWFPRSERLTLVQRGQALLHIWEMGDGMAGTY